VGSDAGRLVVSVLAESGTRRDPLTTVTDLLAQGKLVAAQQLATTLAGKSGELARDAAQRQHEQVQSLRRTAAQDLRAGRDEQAGARLREALRLACDLPELTTELATVPTAPVVGVSAGADGGGVRIAWRPAPDHGDTTTFRVLRRADREPVDAADGQQIPVGSGHSSADDTPPVGRRLHYAVLARTTGGQWSRPVCATTQVIPPVTDVVVEGGRNVITGRWRIHPDVAAVEVRRTAGVPEGSSQPMAVERNRAFRPEARPVVALTATPATGSGLSLRLSWRQRPGAEIVVRRSPQPCPWQYGQVVALAELAGYGTELEGTLTAKGESMTLVAPVPPGRSYCVPFTLDIDSAVRGQDAVVDLAEPVRRVRAGRFGDDLRVTWLWPDAASAADVQWTGGKHRITLQQYRDEGGCQLRGVPEVSQVEVVAVIPGESGESRSPPMSVQVQERPPQLTYQLRRRGHRFIGGVTCVVTLCAAEPVPGVTLIIVAAAGHAMPRSPDAGVELLRQPVVIDPAAPVVLEAPVPRLSKPYWLRCFLAEPAPVQLVDPPVGQLKVS
jgi:hypothetical protein